MFFPNLKKKFSKSFQIETHHHRTRLNPVLLSFFYNTKTWRQKWRQKWSPDKGKWEGRKDYVLVADLNVVLVWREHSANALRMPDKREREKKNCITTKRASLHRQIFSGHHRTNIYQLCMADHYMSWNDTSNLPRNHLVVTLSPQMGGCSRNYWCGTSD